MEKCAVCGKSFKNLKQHDTKMHGGYTVYLVRDGAFMMIDGVAHWGEEPFNPSDGSREFLFYPNGVNAPLAVGVVLQKDGSYKVWSEEGMMKRKYIHNIKVVKTPYNPFE